MPGLHLFFPENDLALAQDTPNYTAPPAAVKLRKAGSTLPLWYGNPGDYVLTEGINARWYNKILSLLGLETQPCATYVDGSIPEPWGWSKASRKFLEIKGVPSDILPGDTDLDRIRELSHRRTAAVINQALAQALPFAIAPEAKEVKSFDEIRAYITSAGAAVVKLPWSSSGRGIIPVDNSNIDRQQQAIEGAIRRQGSVMIETRHDKKLDFAALYEFSGNKCHYAGLSVFDTSGFGSYAGNRLASEDELHDIISDAIGDSRQLDSVLDTLPGILEKIIGTDYDGPLGVDMMAVKADSYSLAPAIELNLRMTMGHVCRRFYDRFVAAGRRGFFTVAPTSQSGLIECTVSDGRISSGSIDLAQPGCEFSFNVSLG